MSIDDLNYRISIAEKAIDIYTDKLKTIKCCCMKCHLRMLISNGIDYTVLQFDKLFKKIQNYEGKCKYDNIIDIINQRKHDIRIFKDYL